MRLIREAVKDLRAHPGRSVLTAVSLFVAVVSIVAIYTVGAVVQGVFIASAEQQAGRSVTVSTRMDYRLLTSERLAQVVATLERRIATAGGVYALVHEVNAQVGEPGAVRRGQQLRGQPITLVAGRLDGVRRMPVLSGQWLPEGDRIYPGGLVVNQSAAALFGGVGSQLYVDLSDRVRPYLQSIIGVVADGNDQPQIYQSLAAALWYQPALLSIGDIPQLLVHHPAAGEGLLRTQVRDVGVELGIDPSEIEVMRADTVAGLLDNLRVTQRAFLGIAVVTLVVAVLGLLNIGLATVRERARDLTIRRAVGATKARVFTLVLCGTVLVGMITALVAVMLAYLAVIIVVPHLLDPASALDPPSFPWLAGLAGLVAAVAAALAGGVAPALAAARVDMALALRE